MSITHNRGTKIQRNINMEITIYNKQNMPVADVVVGSGSYVFNKIQGDSYLQLEFKHGSYIDIRRNAYVIYDDVKYMLLKAVKPTKISTVEYEYSMRLEAPQELLDCFIMSHMAGEGQTFTKAYERNFTLMGTAREHLEMLLLNCQQKSPVTFRIGSVDRLLIGEKMVAYNYISAKSALQLIANAFECEWWVDGNETDGYTLNLGKCSFSEGRPTRLAYGYNNGIMPNASRDLHKDAQRMTHICVQGGSRNINTLSQLTDKEGNPVSPYGFSTLHLPRLQSSNAEGVGSIMYDVANSLFEGETGYNGDNAVLLTIDRQANTMTSSLFNQDEDVIEERAYDMSNFYPQATRSVTAFAFQRNNTEFYIEASGIEEGCDYKAYQLGGEKMTIEFQSGALAGKSFEVISYDHENKRFECAMADYDTISMPSVSEEMWRPSYGDEFIVFGCALPVSYFHSTEGGAFTGAEWDMARRTASILCDNFEDKFAYKFTIDSNWLSRRTEAERKRLKCGYWVHYVDNELAGGGVDIRITDVKVYLNKPYEPELTVGDEVKILSTQQKISQVQSNVSATHNYVSTVQQETQQSINTIQQEGIAKQVQADWAEEDTSEVSFIKHKPKNIATQSWVNDQGYLKAVPSTYALKTEIPTKLSQLSNDASYVSRRSWTPIVGGVNKPSLGGYVIIGYIEHTPSANNEWAVTINLYGGHNTLHGDTRLRIYATDQTATKIGTPTVEFIHGGTSYPNVRLYRESSSRISIGVCRYNNWATATCELVNVTGTSFTAITTEEYKSASAEFLVQCKEMPKDTHTTSRREGVTKMFGLSFDDDHSRWQGAMFVVSSRDDSEENPIGLLIVKYGAYAKDGSLDRKNNCSFIRIAGGSNQIVSFFVDTNSLLNPVVYCNALYSATLRVTPIHNVKDFVLFDTVVPMPETNLLQVRDATLTDGLLSEDKAAELYQQKGSYVTEEWVRSQGYTKNVGTIIGGKMNGSSVVYDNVISFRAAVNQYLQNIDLNTVTEPGMYNAPGGHGCANSVNTSDAFGLIVTHNAGGAYYTQIWHDYLGKVYRRFCKSGTWSAWKECTADWNETDAFSPAYIRNKPQTKAMKVVYEDGTEETLNILYK